MTTMVFVTTISHNHGTDTYVNATRAGVDRTLARYVLENWSPNEEIPALSHGALIAAYFDGRNEDTYEIGEYEVGE